MTKSASNHNANPPRQRGSLPPATLPPSSFRPRTTSFIPDAVYLPAGGRRHGGSPSRPDGIGPAHRGRGAALPTVVPAKWTVSHLATAYRKSAAPKRTEPG